MSPIVTLLLVVIGLVVVGLIVALAIIIRRRPKDLRSTVEARLAEFSERETPITLEEIELSASFSERIIYPAVDAVSGFVGRFTPARVLEQTAHRLELAENPGNMSAANFLVVRFVVMIVLAGLLFGMMLIARLPAGRRTLFTIIALLVGFYLPSLWLESKIKRRQGEIVKQLPDTLDLLTICVEAGLGFDQGVQRVVEKSDNELSRAFGRYLRETSLGIPGRDALLNMSSRVDVPDVTTFVAAIVQAQTLGVAMTKILRIQSDQMRIRRRQRAEQRAHRAPIKMLFPLVFLIFPSIFIILLGPAILLLMESGVIGTVI
jgi:tight adherence protein C